MSITIKFLALALSLLTLPGTCFGVTITVDDDGPADFSSIQDAIDFAKDRDVVEVRPGTYNENIYFNSLAITLTSTNPDDPNVIEATIIRPSSGYGVTFDFGEGLDSILTGFSVIGGGINCLASSPTINKNIIRDCSTRGIIGFSGAMPNITYNTINNNYGGIANCDSSIENNLITGNSASADCGGGLYQCNGTIINNTITENRSMSGGGLYQCDGTIINNMITRNSAITYSQYEDSHGGGLYSCNGTIENNKITGNNVTTNGGHSYGYGGGLYDCDGMISNNTISENCVNRSGSGNTYGGGMYGCDGTIINNKITANRANEAGSEGGGLLICNGTIRCNVISGNIADSGGGLGFCNLGNITNNTIIWNKAYCGGGLYECSAITKNNIIAYNEASIGNGGGIFGTCNNSYNAFWSNVGGNFAGGVSVGKGDINQNPLFAVNGYWDNLDWIEGDYHIKSTGGRYTKTGWFVDGVNSPCIDLGDPTDNVDNETAPNGDRINMGAYGGTVQASRTPGSSITFPGIVENLTVQGGHQCLSLSWDDPCYNGGTEIIAYKIYRGPSEMELAYYNQVAGNELSYTDRDVESGVTYYYTVSAVNGYGEGQQSASVIATANWNDFDLNGDGIINILDFAILGN